MTGTIFSWADLPQPWKCISSEETTGTAYEPARDIASPANQYGYFQFTIQSWYGVGGTGNPMSASMAEQFERAKRLELAQGFGAWPISSGDCGV